MKNPEINKNVVSSPLFPLSPEVVDAITSTFSEFTEAEVEVIRANNLALLPEGPDRYLLEGRARRNLSEEKATSYQAGVAVGISMVRRQVRLCAAEGATHEKPTFDPDKAPVFSKEKLPLILRLFKDLRDIFGPDGGINNIARPAQFFENLDSIVLVGLMKSKWLEARAFMGVGGCDDMYISMGLADALELYADLYKK